MFNKTITYTNSQEAVKPVVLYRDSVKSYSAQRFIAASLLVISIGMVSLQANWVFNANAEGAPVTSPVTSEESPTPTPTPSENPVTSPEESPTPTPSATVAPSSNPGNSNNNNNGGNNGNNNNSNGSGNTGGSSCNNEAPKSAPVIVSAISTGKNEITLNWTPASGNVTEYVVAYGLAKGKPLYGAQFGNVTTVTIKGLSGGVTYYFKVRGGNGCMPGPYSEEIAVKVGGKFINKPAQGFKPGVLGTAKTNKPVVNLVANPKPSSSTNPGFIKINAENTPSTTNTGLFGKIANFLGGIFH